MTPMTGLTLPRRPPDRDRIAAGSHNRTRGSPPH